MLPQANASRTTSYLDEIDRLHIFRLTDYLVPVLTLADLRFNTSVLGAGHVGFIKLAEGMGFTHDYDVALKEATTQDARFLLLKTLYDKKLTTTGIFRRTVMSLTLGCADDTELQSLLHSISFSLPALDYVKAFRASKDRGLLFLAY